MPKERADVGLVGLAVMGQNLVLNMADHGYTVAVYNRTTSVMDAFIGEHPASSFAGTGGGLIGCADLAGFVGAIERPRRIVLLVKAGKPTDAVIDALAPLLEKGDLIVDGGNALWDDTIRRERDLAERGIRFIGSGVSGGEEGARFGPSLMPGGKREAWEMLRPIWESIAAKVDRATGKPLEGAAPGKPVTGGVPCTAYIGPDGSGHFVKMVHNGIEYGDMQMICEAYHLMRTIGRMAPSAIGDVFARWNEGDLDSFLIEITADILRQKDPVTGGAFVDVVLDTAGQKGTGMWTSRAALELGVPAPTIIEAVAARAISAQKEERLAASKRLGDGLSCDPDEAMRRFGFGDAGSFVDAVGRALYCAKICSYAQGFQILRAASEQHGWGLNFGEIAMIWRGGCIIRARFLQRIHDAFAREPGLANLLLDEHFRSTIASSMGAWRGIIACAAWAGVPTPGFGSALAYYDSYRQSALPANLLQAQRDYFGAHTYERIDQPRGKFFHLEWTNPARPQTEA